jgi:nucleoid-associated protein YgaU
MPLTVNPHPGDEPSDSPAEHSPLDSPSDQPPSEQPADQTPSDSPADQPAPDNPADRPPNITPGPPSGDTPPAQSYTVQPGDTLWDIAERVYGNGTDYTLIAKASGIGNPDLIIPGQVLTIPAIPQ